MGDITTQLDLVSLVPCGTMVMPQTKDFYFQSIVNKLLSHKT